MAKSTKAAAKNQATAPAAPTTDVPPALPVAAPVAPAPTANGKCPLSRAEFRAQAPVVLSCTVNGQPIVLERKEFSTGSLGYYANGKILVEIAGKPVKLQIGFNLTVVGSKDLPQ